MQMRFRKIDNEQALFRLKQPSDQNWNYLTNAKPDLGDVVRSLFRYRRPKFHSIIERGRWHSFDSCREG